jgi:hypothetical protein
VADRQTRWCVPIDLGDRGFEDATIEIRDDGWIVLRVLLDEGGPYPNGSSLTPLEACQLGEAARVAGQRKARGG